MSTSSPNLRPWLLAIDASTEQTGLAFHDGTAFAELSWPSGRNQTRTVFAEISRLADLAGCDLRRDLGCVAVATGPGMFNGLRVGVSIAKGFALANGVDLIGVPTLSIAAHPFGPSGRPVLVVAAAGRKRLLWRRFEASTLIPAGPAVNGAVQEFAAALETLAAETIVTGELAPDLCHLVANRRDLVLAPPPAHVRSANSLAAIAWPRWRAGDVDNAESLAPVYLHASTTPATATY